ncbi:MAG: hypothetical protein KDA24_03060 [Deltaproteobacteria bacterium]|nr:hypothetical protein [Deltaproteobacteria bacterium]
MKTRLWLLVAASLWATPALADHHEEPQVAVVDAETQRILDAITLPVQAHELREGGMADADINAVLDAAQKAGMYASATLTNLKKAGGMAEDAGMAAKEGAEAAGEAAAKAVDRTTGDTASSPGRARMEANNKTNAGTPATSPGKARLDANRKESGDTSTSPGKARLDANRDGSNDSGGK